MVLAYSDRIPRAPPYSLPSEFLIFNLQDYHLVLRGFPSTSAILRICNSYDDGLFPFQSPLLGESLLLSFPAATKMFQFTAFASPKL